MVLGHFLVEVHRVKQVVKQPQVLHVLVVVEEELVQDIYKVEWPVVLVL
jgi:methionine-rich copper-binding protein CopC